MKSVRRSFVPLAVGIVLLGRFKQTAQEFLLRFVVRFCVDSSNDIHNTTVKGCFNLAFETMLCEPDVSGGGSIAVQREVRREAWTFAVGKQ
eukprot:13809460-Ditylum_brightwellii.AAC.1